MPVSAPPAPTLYPPFNIVRLSHVELAGRTVADLAKSRAFYADTLGLQVTDETADTIYLRAMEERGHHCLVLRKASAPCARRIDRLQGLRSEDGPRQGGASHSSRQRACRSTGCERPYQCANASARFVTRHGIPLEFYSQNGPNSILAARSTSNMRSTRG